MLGARIIGFYAKFFNSAVTGLFHPGYFGILADSTSCEDAIFTAPNPFTSMTAEVFTGATVSQTQTISLTTAWGDCGYTYTISPAQAWLTQSSPSTNQI